MPDAHHVFRVDCQNARAIGADSDAFQPFTVFATLMAKWLSDERPVFRIPHSHGLILARRDDSHSIGREKNFQHFLRVAQNGGRVPRGKSGLRAGFAIPGADQFVLAGAQEKARAVRAEKRAGAPFGIRRSAPEHTAHALACRRVPQLPVALDHSHDARPIGAELRAQRGDLDLHKTFHG